MPYPSHYVPCDLRHEPDSQSPGRFRVVRRDGTVFAEGIPTETAARLFAASPGLALGYEELQDRAVALFYCTFDIKPSRISLNDFLEDDDGELEEEYPGAREDAAELKELLDRLQAIKEPDGYLPIEPPSDPQLPLF